MRTSITVIMTDDTVFEKPFISDVHAEKIALGNIEVLRSELPRFSIHATQSQWRALAAYCLECADDLETANTQTFTNIAKALTHIKAEHPDHGHLAESLPGITSWDTVDTSLDKTATAKKLYNLNILHTSLHKEIDA